MFCFYSLISSQFSNAVLATKRDCDDKFAQAMSESQFSPSETKFGLDIFNLIESQREIGVTCDLLKVWL